MHKLRFLNMRYNSHFLDVTTLKMAGDPNTAIFICKLKNTTCAFIITVATEVAQSSEQCLEPKAWLYDLATL